MGHEQWGADHFGFKVTDGFLAYCSEIKNKGVVFLVEPLEIRPGTHIAFIQGPDKETIELVEG
jgi:catechol 2,3-dioxygenase-like lactoylglutathione lyase family enzyme